jgi:hypothetical protein
MVEVMDILRVANKGGIEPPMDLLYQKQQQIPGSIHYNIRRYYAQHPWVADDTGYVIVPRVTVIAPKKAVPSVLNYPPITAAVNTKR